MGLEQKVNAEGKYIYCIIQCDGKHEFAFPGIGSTNRIYTINFENLGAVVSDSPVTRYDIGRQNTIAHERAIEHVMQQGYDVVPVRFGTVAQSADQVSAKLLKRRFALLHGLLNQVENRIEVGLKAFWNKEQIFREIVEQDAEIKAYRNALALQPADQTYAARIELGGMVEAALIAKRDEEAEQILAALRPLAEDTRINPHLGDMMILNAAFLVRRDRQAEFDAQAEALDRAQGSRINFKYVAPVPPFNFVNLVVNWNEG